MANQGKLIIAGIGIKLISHLTHEVKLAIESADDIFYLSYHPLMDKFLKSLNPNANSLNYFYSESDDRISVYRNIRDLLVNAVKEGKNVCMVFYGHPCVFAMPGRMAIEELKKDGYSCQALPGISAMACIFSDLLIDPAFGCASFEASDLILSKKKLILLSITLFGSHTCS